MWRTIAVGLGLVLAAAALAQTAGQPPLNAQSVSPPPSRVGPPTISPSPPTIPGPAASPVDCGNGNVCPAGNACLEDGLCAPEVDIESLPGVVRTSVGGWCLPGFHENRFERGKCTHNSRVECPDGVSCAAGRTCDGKGGCTGGGGNGPICDATNPRRCEDSTDTCTSRGTCIASYNRQCASGRVCDKQSACAIGGCVLVGTTRTAQVPRGTPR